MHHHGVSWSVEVENGRLGDRLRKEALQEAGDILGKLRRKLVGVHAVCPIILATQRNPVQFSLQDLFDGEWLVDVGVFGDERSGTVWVKGEERPFVLLLTLWVWQVIMEVEVSLMLWIT